MEAALPPGTVAVLVLLVAPAHVLPEAHGGSKLLQDHADEEPSCVVVQLGDGQATTESLDILQLLGGGA